MKAKAFFKRTLSFVLALVMVVTAFAVGAPEEVQAAELSFKSSGKDSVTLSDTEAYDLVAQKPITQYIKYKAGATGYITLTFTSNSQLVTTTGAPVVAEGDITLCNSKKKAIAAKEPWYCQVLYPGDNVRTFGVKKGQTYYFKVESWGGVTISSNVVKVAKSTGNSKAKAKNVAKGKTAKGVMIAGEKKADWYKIKLTKSSKLKLSFTAKTMGYANKAGIRFTFMDTKGKKWTSTSYCDLTAMNPENGMTITMKNKYGALFDIEAGTYYVKVEPMNKKSSGYYTLKWSTF